MSRSIDVTLTNNNGNDDTAAIDVKLEQLFTTTENYFSSIRVNYRPNQVDNGEQTSVFDNFLDMFLNKIILFSNDNATSAALHKIESLNFDCRQRVSLTATRANKILNIVKKLMQQEPTSQIVCNIKAMIVTINTMECLYPRTKDDLVDNMDASSKITLLNCPLYHGEERMSCTTNHENEENAQHNYPMEIFAKGCKLNLETTKNWIQQLICPLQNQTNLEVQALVFHDVSLSMEAFQYLQQQKKEKCKNENKERGTTQKSFSNIVYYNCLLFDYTQNGVRRKLLNFSGGNQCDHVFESFQTNLENKDEEQGDVIFQSLLHMLGEFENPITAQQMIFRGFIIYVEIIPTLLSHVTQPEDGTLSITDVVFEDCKIKKISSKTNYNVTSFSSNAIAPHKIRYDTKNSSLSLSARNIQDTIEPMSTIALLLRECSAFHHIKSLQLGSVGDLEISHLVRILTHQETSLKSIRFCCKGITNMGMTSLAMALKSNSKLEQINMICGGTPKSVPSLEPILNILRNDLNTSLTKFWVGFLDLVHFYGIPFYNEINFYTKLNKYGRRNLLQSELSGNLLCLWLAEKWDSSKSRQIGNEQEDSIHNASSIYWILTTFPHVLFAKN